MPEPEFPGPQWERDSYGMQTSWHRLAGFSANCNIKSHEPRPSPTPPTCWGENLWTSPFFCSSCPDDGNIQFGDAQPFLLMMKPQFEKEQSAAGEFQRQEDAFRSWISTDGSTPYPAEAGRYHLYVSLACPWASRTVIFRKLKGLEKIIGLTVVDPVRDERGWAFRDGPGFSADPVNGFAFLSEAYEATTTRVRWPRHGPGLMG